MKQLGVNLLTIAFWLGYGFLLFVALPATCWAIWNAILFLLGGK